MKKKDLVEALVRRGLERKAAETAIYTFLEAIGGALKAGKRVLIHNFGVFYVKDVAGYKKFNPLTGTDCEIKAGRRVRFKASKALNLIMDVDGGDARRVARIKRKTIKQEGV